jgi:hypothetical protein
VVVGGAAVVVVGGAVVVVVGGAVVEVGGRGEGVVGTVGPAVDGEVVGEAGEAGASGNRVDLGRELTATSVSVLRGRIVGALAGRAMAMIAGRVAVAADGWLASAPLVRAVVDVVVGTSGGVATTCTPAAS